MLNQSVVLGRNRMQLYIAATSINSKLHAYMCT